MSVPLGSFLTSVFNYTLVDFLGKDTSLSRAERPLDHGYMVSTPGEVVEAREETHHSDLPLNRTWP